MKRISNEYGIRLQKISITITGTWPKRSASFMYETWGIFNCILAFISSVMLLRSFFIISDFSQFIENWNMCMAFLAYSIKLITIHCKRQKLLTLLDFLNDSIFSSHHPDLDKHIRRSIMISDSIMKVFQCSACCTLLFMEALPLFATKQRQLPLEFCLDLIEKPIVIYIVIYCFQVFSISTAGVCSAGVDCLVCSMMGLVAAHFRILRETIQTMTSSLVQGNALTVENYGKNDEEIADKLKKCVQVHVAIIKFAELIEDIFSYYFLSQFLASAVSMCMMGFMFITSNPGSSDFLHALTFLGSLLLQISIYCIYGNAVMVESSEVGQACYTAEWTNCGPKIRKHLFLIMERAKRPTVFTAGKFVDLSLSSLVAILKAAVSYATVLRQLYNE